MKSVNRKFLLSLLGIASATPFVVIAIAIGFRVASLANSLQGGLLVAGLAIVSVVVGMGEGRIGLKEAAARQPRMKSKATARFTLPHGY